MAENKMCPHCGGKMFGATITRGCVVEVSTSEQGEDTYKVLKEVKDKFDIKILKCARCKNDVTDEDLVTSVVCKECGKVVSPLDINQDGMCNICAAIKERSEIANASREELIKMLLEAEKKSNSVASKMDKKIKEAEEINEPTPVPNNSDPISEETDTNAPKEQPAEEVPEKKTKRRTVKRTKTTKEETTEEVQEQTEPESEAVESAPVPEEAINEIANQQEAPFPEVNTGEEETVVTEKVEAKEELPTEVDLFPQTESPADNEEQPIGASISLFDDGEEPF